MLHMNIKRHFFDGLSWTPQLLFFGLIGGLTWDINFPSAEEGTEHHASMRVLPRMKPDLITNSIACKSSCCSRTSGISDESSSSNKLSKRGTNVWPKFAAFSWCWTVAHARSWSTNCPDDKDVFVCWAMRLRYLSCRAGGRAECEETAQRSSNPWTETHWVRTAFRFSSFERQATEMIEPAGMPHKGLSSVHFGVVSSLLIGRSAWKKLIERKKDGHLLTLSLVVFSLVDRFSFVLTSSQFNMWW